MRTILSAILVPFLFSDAALAAKSAPADCAIQYARIPSAKSIKRRTYVILPNGKTGYYLYPDDQGLAVVTTPTLKVTRGWGGRPVRHVDTSRVKMDELIPSVAYADLDAARFPKVAANKLRIQDGSRVVLKNGKQAKVLEVFPNGKVLVSTRPRGPSMFPERYHELVDIHSLAPEVSKLEVADTGLFVKEGAIVTLPNGKIGKVNKTFADGKVRVDVNNSGKRYHHRWASPYNDAKMVDIDDVSVATKKLKIANTEFPLLPKKEISYKEGMTVLLPNGEMGEVNEVFFNGTLRVSELGRGGEVGRKAVKPEGIAPEVSSLNLPAGTLEGQDAPIQLKSGVKVMGRDGKVLEVDSVFADGSVFATGPRSDWARGTSEILGPNEIVVGVKKSGKVKVGMNVPDRSGIPSQVEEIFSDGTVFVRKKSGEVVEMKVSDF